MNAQDRRKSIVNLLLSSQTAISGAELSKKFQVSRQIIVQDISVLKASGYDIISTHKGYIIHRTPLAERIFKVFHSKDQTEKEFNLIIENGGTVVDVFVWHKVYGKVVANLNIFSKMHIAQFIDGVRSGKSSELMNITGGYHYHTVRAENEQILDKIERLLTDDGYIVAELE